MKHIHAVRSLVISLVALAAVGCNLPSEVSSAASSQKTTADVTSAATIVCPTGMTAMPATKGRAELCVDDTWKNGQQVTSKVGNHTQATAACTALGRTVCTVDQLLHSCDDGYMPGGYFWAKEKSGSTGSAVYSCGAVDQRALTEVRAYLCCQ